ncbi:unnamed protein product [Ectocarpus sp. 8 AP-2014]
MVVMVSVLVSYIAVYSFAWCAMGSGSVSNCLYVMHDGCASVSIFMMDVQACRFCVCFLLLESVNVAIGRTINSLPSAGRGESTGCVFAGGFCYTLLVFLLGSLEPLLSYLPRLVGGADLTRSLEKHATRRLVDATRLLV